MSDRTWPLGEYPFTAATQAHLMARICAFGIPTDVAEIEAQIRELIEQRDELLAALKAMVNPFKFACEIGAPDCDAEQHVRVKQARAAIARAQSTIAPGERTAR